MAGWWEAAPLESEMSGGRWWEAAPLEAPRNAAPIVESPPRPMGRPSAPAEAVTPPAVSPPLPDTEAPVSIVERAAQARVAGLRRIGALPSASAVAVAPPQSPVEPQVDVRQPVAPAPSPAPRGAAFGGWRPEAPVVATRLTEEDRASPLPDDLIEQGRGAIARAVGEEPSAPVAPSGPPDEASVAAAASGLIPQGATLLGTFHGNGRVYRTADGRMGAVNADGSTTDPESVERIMQGDTFAEIVRDSVDQQRIAANPVAARVQEFNRGVPFVGTYLDEAVGVVSPQAAENMRDLSEAMGRQNPIETAALGIAGGVAGAVPMAMAAAPSIGGAMAGAPVYARVGTGLLSGAATGGVEGAITGFGDGLTIAERVANAQGGAIGGAVVGGVLGGAGGLGTVAVRNMLLRLRGSDRAVIAREMGLTPEAAGIVRNALEAGGVDEAMSALERAGPNAMLADAGVPARQLLDAASQSGGAGGRIAREAVEERTQAATAEMTAELDRILGAPRGEREIITSIREGTQPARSAAYNAAYSAPIDYSSDAGRRIETLLSRIPPSAVRRAQQIMDVDGAESAQIIARVEALPNGREQVTYERLPDVRTVHLLLQGLDDVVRTGDGQGALGGQTTLGRSYQSLRRDLSEAMADAVPEFAEAQATAADAIRRREAVDLGYSLLRNGTRREDVAEAVSAGGRRAPQGQAAAVATESAEGPQAGMTAQDVLRQYQGMSEAERSAAREGLRAYVDDAMASVTRTVADPDSTTREGIRVLRDFSSRANRTKLRLLLGPERAEELLGSIDQAATAFDLRAAVSENSRTAVRQSIQGGVRDAAEGGLVRSLMRGGPVDATKNLVQAITGETPEAVRLREMGLHEEIARALTGIRGEQARRSLQLIREAMEGQNLSAEQAEAVAAALVLPPVLASDRLSAPLRGERRVGASEAAPRP